MLEAFPPGGYRHIKAVFQYSSGVAAKPGFEIERVRLHDPLLAEGFRFVEAHLDRLGRPRTAFAACELRPAARRAAASGLAWHFARPPVVGLEFEMDVRGDARELVL